jgi:hypothetical protein
MPVIPVTVGSIKLVNLGPGQSGQKVSPYLQNNQSKNDLEGWGREMTQALYAHMNNKTIKKKRIWGMAQVVECLLSKC